MKTSREALLFFAALFALLLLQFRGELSSGHYLSLLVIEDPAARYSFLPWDMLSARELHGGRFPLWNPFSAGGMPLLANLQCSPLMPLKWLFFLFPSVRMLDLFALLRLAVCGTFMFMLARELSLSPLPAALSGIALTLSGYLMKHLNQVNISSEMWVPLILLLAFKSRRGMSFRRFAAMCLAWFLVAVGGNPEAAFYAALYAFGFCLFLKPREQAFVRWTGMVFVLPLAAGLLAAGAQLVPFFEYLGQGFHIHHPGLPRIARFPAADAGSLVAPWMLGFFGSHPGQLTSAPYLGVIVFSLGLVPVFGGGLKRRDTLFFMSALVALLGLVYRVPPFCWLEPAPPFNRMGNVKFAMFGAAFSFSLLAGRGLEEIVFTGRGPRGFAAPAGVAGAALLLAAFYARSLAGKIWLPGFAAPVAFLVLSGALCLLLARSKDEALKEAPKKAGPWRQRGLSLGLVFLCWLELFVNFQGYSGKSEFEPDWLKWKNPAAPSALAPLLEAGPEARFLGIGGTLHPNLNLLFNLSDFRAFDALYPARYVEFMGKIEGFSMDQAVENFFSHGWSFDVRPENLGHPLVDLAGISHVASRKELSVEGLRLVREGDIKIYENLEAWPRAWVWKASMEEPGPEKPYAERLLNLGWKEAEAVGEVAPARVLESSWDRVTVKAKGPGRLILADTYFAGWRAENEEREIPVTTFFGLFRATPLEAGEQVITFIYKPWGFRVGLWLSIAGVFCLAGVGAWGRPRKRVGHGSSEISKKEGQKNGGADRIRTGE